MEKNIYLIFTDSIDDACAIFGYIYGTEEEADRYCDEHNKNCRFSWEEITWERLERLNQLCEKDKNLKHYRTKAGLSQAQLAKAAGLSLRTLQDYEQGRKPLEKAAAITVLNLARCLGCNVEDLIDEKAP